MGAYTGAQLMTRLLALALGLAGGLSETVWSHVVGMRCGAVKVGEYVLYTDCLPWTELFLRFPEHLGSQMVSLLMAGAIAGLVAGFVGMWRPLWAAVLFLLLALLNLGLSAFAAATVEQKGIALGLAVLAVVVPAVCAIILWWRGEYRVRRRPATLTGETDSFGYRPNAR